MITFTSSLPDDLMSMLTDTANKLKLPKNKLIEKALRVYLEQLNKAEYAKSYKEAGEDVDVMMVAEEEMQDYYKQIKD